MNKIINTVATLLLTTTVAQADNVIVDDLIVNGGSICVGFDCVNGESFGFDTLRLKENNLHLHFDDTSSSASFPNNDWRIVINDSSNGGGNYFAIEDSTAARTVFKIEAGAPTNSLYVDNGGDVGIGTSSPVVEVHAVDGNTPTLRLEQDGSSGFTPQTWDLAGNETNFFIRDVSNGSSLPFRIRPGAPTDSIDIAANGNIGMGTSSAQDDLHIKDTAGAARLRLTSNKTSSTTEDSDWIVNSNGTFRVSAGSSNTPQLVIQADNKVGLGTSSPEDDLHISDTGPARLRLTNTAATSATTTDQDWILNSNGTFRISAGSDSAELILSANGNLTILGTLTTAGSCSSGCDLVFSEDYKLPSIEEHALAMWKNSYLPTVGPTHENAPFNITEKTGRMLNELEKAHIYIDQLNTRLNTKEQDLKIIQTKFSQLEQRLSKLEFQ